AAHLPGVAARPRERPQSVSRPASCALERRLDGTEGERGAGAAHACGSRSRTGGAGRSMGADRARTGTLSPDLRSLCLSGARPRLQQQTVLACTLARTRRRRTDETERAAPARICRLEPPETHDETVQRRADLPGVRATHAVVLAGQDAREPGTGRSARAKVAPRRFARLA